MEFLSRPEQVLVPQYLALGMTSFSGFRIRSNYNLLQAEPWLSSKRVLEPACNE